MASLGLGYVCSFVSGNARRSLASVTQWSVAWRQRGYQVSSAAAKSRKSIQFKFIDSAIETSGCPPSACDATARETPIHFHNSVSQIWDQDIEFKISKDIHSELHQSGAWWPDDRPRPIFLPVSTSPGDGLNPECLAVSMSPGDWLSPECLTVSTWNNGRWMVDIGTNQLWWTMSVKVTALKSNQQKSFFSINYFWSLNRGTALSCPICFAKAFFKQPGQ